MVEDDDGRGRGGGRRPSGGLLLEFSGEVWHWRGPAPYHFVTVPDEKPIRPPRVCSLRSTLPGTLPTDT